MQTRRSHGALSARDRLKEIFSKPESILHSKQHNPYIRFLWHGRLNAFFDRMLR
jgi:hypothetical protein